MAEAKTQVLEFSQLRGWGKDDLAPALAAFAETCARLPGPDWGEACDAARSTDPDDARSFFETQFRPVVVGNPKTALFTGYYEPELTASAVRTAKYRFPIYRRPPEMIPGRRWFSRAEIEDRHILQGRGLEIAWLSNPVDVFFLQVQGSGRLLLTDGRVMRVGFAAKNGHPYRSIGKELKRRGVFGSHGASAARIRAWALKHPEEGREILRFNPSFVFFRVLDLSHDHGPLGALQVPLTAGRSLAVDPRFVPLGAPVWIDKHGRHPIRRLMVAQDTGTAIKGAQRADIFYGSGAGAGRAASGVHDGGRIVVLMPVARAVAMADGG
nr:murein transglycosylase A [Acidimangrovimonas sediminis]